MSYHVDLEHVLDRMEGHAQQVAGYVDMLLNELRGLDSDIQSMRGQLGTVGPSIVNGLEDDARELETFKQELGRIHDSVLRMRQDCGAF